MSDENYLGRISLQRSLEHILSFDPYFFYEALRSSKCCRCHCFLHWHGLGRYALPGTKNSSVTKPSVVASAAVVSPVPLARAPAVAAAEPDHDSEQLPAGASAQAIIAKIKTALLHTGRQRIYTDLNKLSDSIDQHNARAILAFVETLRDNEKSMVLPIVISRWAELDPQAASGLRAKSSGRIFSELGPNECNLRLGGTRYRCGDGVGRTKCRRASNANKQCRQSFLHWPIKIQRPR